ncbi:MAG TPA: IS1595 family transposase [Alphaproteobacteria bacterium]|nr:IS1595 family transposase [Alphaproteobacteria bacterium]
MSNSLSSPIFHDADKAREWLEARIWKNGPICPHCGVEGQATLMQGKTTRPGLYNCNACREPFTVTVGTLYERSKIPLNKWLAATFLIMSSKKGISALQVGRMIGVSKKTAWFLCHRIRESLRDTDLSPIGGQNKVVEIDETYVGGKEKNKHANKRLREGRGAVGKAPVVSLVERGGNVRSMHLPEVTSKTLRPILETHISKKTYLMTDESKVYPPITDEFAGHGTVNHSAGEYGRGVFWHTNTVENYFSILKRGIVGTFHHVSQQHLARYVAEFDYRYNNREGLGVDDMGRFEKSVPGIVGKRLTYRRPNEEMTAP